MNLNRQQIELKHSDIIQTAIRMMDTITDPEHMTGHTLDVVDNVCRIIEKLPDNTELDLDMCIICAYWHDIGRTQQGPGHEALSAEMLATVLASNGFSNEWVEKCKKSIVNHKWNAPRPETLEGVVLKDADKIAFLELRRWKDCLEHNFVLSGVMEILPKLRNDIFILDESRELYDIDIVVLLKNLYLGF
jgi:HD superfamily phosphodiesterase